MKLKRENKKNESMDSSNQSKAQRKASGYPDAVLTIVLFIIAYAKRRVMVPMHTAPLQDHASVSPPGLCEGTGVKNGSMEK